MIEAATYIEMPWQRAIRWSGAAGIIAALHAAMAAYAFLLWPAEEPRQEMPRGAIMIDLAALAAESASDQEDLSDQQEIQKAAPPPSPVDSDDPPEESSATDTPPSPQPEQTMAPAQSSPSPQAEDEPAAAEETPPVNEAPLAPEPEVTLPKPEPVKQAETAKEQPNKTDRKESKPPAAKAAAKSDSKQQKKSAASSAGRFDPNPVYRASPAYPPGARAQKVEGHVVVAYTVSPSGAVSNVRVVSATPPGVFNSASLAAVRQWRFKPSPNGASGRSTTIRFKLR